MTDSAPPVEVRCAQCGRLLPPEKAAAGAESSRCESCSRPAPPIPPFGLRQLGYWTWKALSEPEKAVASAAAVPFRRAAILLIPIAGVGWLAAESLAACTTGSWHPAARWPADLLLTFLVLSQMGLSGHWAAMAAGGKGNAQDSAAVALLAATAVAPAAAGGLAASQLLTVAGGSGLVPLLGWTVAVAAAFQYARVWLLGMHARHGLPEGRSYGAAGGAALAAAGWIVIFALSYPRSQPRPGSIPVRAEELEEAPALPFDLAVAHWEATPVPTPTIDLTPLDQFHIAPE